MDTLWFNCRALPRFSGRFDLIKQKPNKHWNVGSLISLHSLKRRIANGSMGAHFQVKRQKAEASQWPFNEERGSHAIMSGTNIQWSENKVKRAKLCGWVGGNSLNIHFMKKKKNLGANKHQDVGSLILIFSLSLSLESLSTWLLSHNST